MEAIPLPKAEEERLRHVRRVNLKELNLRLDTQGEALHVLRGDVNSFCTFRVFQA